MGNRRARQVPGRSDAGFIRHAPGKQRPIDAQQIDRVFADPVVRELLAQTRLTRLAYTAFDGSPRVVPIGFVVRSSRVIVVSASIAPKVRALRRDPRVALTIDIQAQPREPCCCEAEPRSRSRSSTAYPTNTWRLRIWESPTSTGPSSRPTSATSTTRWHGSRSRSTGRRSSTFRPGCRSRSTSWSNAGRATLPAHRHRTRPLHRRGLARQPPGSDMQQRPLSRSSSGPLISCRGVCGQAVRINPTASATRATAMSPAPARVSFGPSRGLALLADGEVHEEASGLGEHAHEQHNPSGPLEPVGELRARQVEQVDERQHLQHTRMGMPGTEEPLFPSGHSLTTRDEGQQRPAAVLDGHEQENGDDGKDVRGFMRRPDRAQCCCSAALRGRSHTAPRQSADMPSTTMRLAVMAWT